MPSLVPAVKLLLALNREDQFAGLNSLPCQGLDHEPEQTPRVKDVTPRSGWMTAQRTMGEIWGTKTTPQHPPNSKDGFEWLVLISLPFTF